MGLSNDMIYLDEHMSCVYWRPDLIFKDIDRDMLDVNKKLAQKYIRIEEYELLYLKQRILLDDWKLFFKVLERLSSKVAEKNSFVFPRLSSFLAIQFSIYTNTAYYIKPVHIIPS